MSWLYKHCYLIRIWPCSILLFDHVIFLYSISSFSAAIWYYRQVLLFDTVNWYCCSILSFDTISLYYWSVAVADERGWSGLTSVPKELGGLTSLQNLSLHQNGAWEQGGLCVWWVTILDTQPPKVCMWYSISWCCERGALRSSSTIRCV